MENDRNHGNDEHSIPQPTIWPLVMALGITLLAAGLATNAFVLVTGVALFALALWGWVRDLLNEGIPPVEADHVGPERGQGGSDV